MWYAVGMEHKGTTVEANRRCRLAVAQRRRGHTQARAAREIGVSEQTYNRWMNWRCLPTPLSAEAIELYIQMS